MLPLLKGPAPGTYETPVALLASLLPSRILYTRSQTRRQLVTVLWSSWWLNTQAVHIRSSHRQGFNLSPTADTLTTRSPRLWIHVYCEHANLSNEIVRNCLIWKLDEWVSVTWRSRSNRKAWVSIKWLGPSYHCTHLLQQHWLAL